MYWPKGTDFTHDLSTWSVLQGGHRPRLLFVVVINTMTKSNLGKKKKELFALLVTVLHPGQAAQEPEAGTEAENMEVCLLLACLVTFLK